MDGPQSADNTYLDGSQHKRACPLFDENGQNVNFSFVIQTKKNDFIETSSNLSECAKALCPFHSSTMVLSPALT